MLCQNGKKIYFLSCEANRVFYSLSRIRASWIRTEFGNGEACLKIKELITMKIFQRYNPLQIAKYVKTLFKGRLYIKDVGAFEFDKGKVLIPLVKDKQHLSVMSEINRQVVRLKLEFN